MSKTKGKTSDAVELLRRHFVAGDAEMGALVRQERDNANVARQIYDLRTRAGLTQQQLAALVQTTASVICRLEDADYEGHSLNMLHRIAAALGNRVEVRFVPLEGGTRTAGAANKGRRATPARTKTRRPE